MPDKVEYWLNLCDEDIKVANSMFKEKHYLYAGFFWHMIAEKAIKAVIESVKTQTPPKSHDLYKLAKFGDIFDNLSESQINLLDELNPLQIEARYPDYKATITGLMTGDKTTRILKETEDFLCWIKQELGR